MYKIFLSIFLIIFVLSYSKPDINIEISDHYNGNKFHNIGYETINKSFLDFLKWRFLSKREKWPEWVEIKQQKIESQIVKNGSLNITFINHATILIQIDQINIITDPVYAQRVSPFSFIGPKRVKLPGVKLSDLPKIDIILISHNHYDSFDIDTIRKLVKRDSPKILFGLGNKHYLDDNIKKYAHEMDWGDEFLYNNLKIIFLPAKHWSKRGIWDTNKSLWGSFAILGSKKVYFAGDTGYSKHFADINKRFNNFDLSLIPIGAYEPRWFMKEHHLNPQEAVIAHMDLKSNISIGFHFGTFQLTNEAIDKPIMDLIVAKEKYNIRDENFMILQQGASYKYQ